MFIIIKRSTLSSVHRKLDKLMATIDERFKAVSDGLDTVGTSLAEASGKLAEGQAEILAELEKLRQGGLTPEQETLLQGIESKVQATSTVATSLDDAAKTLADISPPVGG